MTKSPIFPLNNYFIYKTVLNKFFFVNVFEISSVQYYVKLKRFWSIAQLSIKVINSTSRNISNHKFQIRIFFLISFTNELILRNIQQTFNVLSLNHKVTIAPCHLLLFSDFVQKWYLWRFICILKFQKRRQKYEFAIAKYDKASFNYATIRKARTRAANLAPIDFPLVLQPLNSVGDTFFSVDRFVSAFSVAKITLSKSRTKPIVAYGSETLSAPQ